MYWEFPCRQMGTMNFIFPSKMGVQLIPFTKENIDDRNHFIKMKGRETFKSAVKTMVKDSLATLERVGLSPDQVNWMVPHQANMRILEAVAKRMDFPLEKVVRQY